MNIKMFLTGIDTKTDFIQALEDYGFEINRMAKLTEAVLYRDNTYTIVTIADDGGIVIFSKYSHEAPDTKEIRISTFEAPQTSTGYNVALSETRKVIS